MEKNKINFLKTELENELNKTTDNFKKARKEPFF